ncbi:MAG: GNAT family N-acetyltransferase [Candidatus Bathyarchaeota archaeon]|nr:GNAT family N-acetyltransferase [Candidatus Bathyarchaeota archaeon]
MNLVRLLEPDDFKTYVRLSLEAYPAMITGLTPEKEEGWAKRMQERQAEKGDIQYYGYFRDDEMLGAMRTHTFKMNIHGVDMLAGGVGNICVDLTHKKEHIAKEMMEYYHKLYWEMGAPFVLLWPFRHDFYRKMGYGYGRKYNKYSYKPCDLPRGSRLGVGFMGEDDVDALLECYNRYVSASHGMIYKKRGFFERFINTYKVVGYRNGDRVEGFIGFNFKKLYPEHPLMQNIEIEYMVYENPRALSRLLAFLQTQLDQVNRVIFQTFDDDLHYVSHDPRNESVHIFFINQESNVQGVGIMYRILDKERFFKQLADHSFNGESVRVKFDVSDTFVPENNGPITVHFIDGKPVLGEGYDVEVSLNIEHLSSLMMGVVDFKKLWTYGLVKLSNEFYVEQLDRLFHCRYKPETVEEF